MGNKTSNNDGFNDSVSFELDEQQYYDVSMSYSFDEERETNNTIKRKELIQPKQSILTYSRTEVRLQNEIDAKISKQQRYLIFGYVHDNITNITIPMPIIYLFAAFYCIFRDEWNKQFCGSDYIFIGHKIIKKINKNRWSLCAFGYEVNNKICDTLTIQFTWKSEMEISSNRVQIGYIKKDKLVTIKWDDYGLGYGQNKNNSVCVDVHDHSNTKYYHQYDSNTDSDDDDIDGYEPGSDHTFSVQTYTLSFNFIDKKMIIYKNKKKLNSIKFKCKSIIPAIAIYNEGELVEVSKYELTKNV